MGGKSKAPPPPAPTPPRETSAAQTGTNVSTAVANAMLGNVNQVGPNGERLDWNVTGNYNWTDAYTGTTYNIPTFTATQTLSPQQRAQLDQTNAAELNLATIANQQTGFLRDYLNRPVSTEGLPSRPVAPTIETDFTAAAQQQRVGAAPRMNTGFTAGEAMERSNAPISLRMGYNNDFSADRDKVESALFARMNPQIERDRAALEARLANQGIKIGSQAYSAAMDDFGRNTNDARLATILGASQEQSRLAGLARDEATFGNQAALSQFGMGQQAAAFNNQARQSDTDNRNRALSMANEAMGGQTALDQSVAGFNNQAGLADAASWNAMLNARNNAAAQGFDMQNAARNSALQETFALRNQPLNEISALMSGSQVSQPSFVNANMPRIANTDNAGIIANYDNQRLQAWQAEANAAAQRNAQQGALWGNIIGAAGTLGGAWLGRPSDKKLKEDIEPVGKLKGHTLYEYSMKGDPSGKREIGVMAQEVKKKRPDAVRKAPGKDYLEVDYGRLFAAGGR